MRAVAVVQRDDDVCVCVMIARRAPGPTTNSNEMKRGVPRRHTHTEKKRILLSRFEKRCQSSEKRERGNGAEDNDNKRGAPTPRLSTTSTHDENDEKHVPLLRRAA